MIVSRKSISKIKFMVFGRRILTCRLQSKSTGLCGTQVFKLFEAFSYRREFSKAIVYEPPKTDDANEIHFVELGEEEFRLNRNKMLRTKSNRSQSKTGSSWMARECPRPFAERWNPLHGAPLDAFFKSVKKKKRETKIKMKKCTLSSTKNVRPAIDLN